MDRGGAGVEEGSRKGGGGGREEGGGGNEGERREGESRKSGMERCCGKRGE